MYWRLAEWSATVERLGQFGQAIEASRSTGEPMPAGPTLTIERLSVLYPDGEPMLSPLTARIEAGEWVRLEDPSGIGKSSMLRALHGLWPYFEGQWQTPPGRQLVLPQHPYLAQIPLRQLLAYPAHLVPSDQRLRQALETVGLGSWRLT